MELCFRLSDDSPAAFITAKAYSSNRAILELLASRFFAMPHQPINAITDVEVSNVDFSERNHEQNILKADETHNAIQKRVGNGIVPIICLHGWLDNAASFDLLLPQIINRMRSGGSERHVVAIAIDLAGHGLSSHLTVRSEYSPAAYVRDLYSVLNHLGASWQKELILIGHSMGGAVANIFCSAFPEMVHRLVLIENLGPFSYLPEHYAKNMRNHVLNWHNLFSKSLPVYKNLHQAEEARQKGTAKGTLSRHGAHVLVERGIVDSSSGKKLSPWNDPPKDCTWTWRTDQRLMLPPSSTFTEDQVLEILRGIQCPVLLVLGDRGYGFDKSDQDFPWMNSSVRFSAFKQIRKRIYPGGHHLHLDSDSVKLIAADIVDGVLNGKGKL